MKTMTKKQSFFSEYGRFLFAALFIILLFMAVLFLLPGKTAAAKNTPESVYKIAAVSIEAGDSLWSIATEYYSSEFSSIEEYISEINRMNGLKSDTIYAGNYILVPYYTN